MNENLNLVKILKDVSKGTKLWSPICGKCTFVGIDDEGYDDLKSSEYPIICKNSKGTNNSFTKEGKLYATYDDTECVLFPSKENRDWSKFRVHKQHFKPFQKVLRAYYVTCDRAGIWVADFYSHYDEALDNYYFSSGYVINGDSCIIPYEGNEDKLGKPVE